jgi:alpha-beta hydrolase superfamily lysophospholipase
MPVLVQQAGADRIVDADKVRQFFDNLASQDKAWKIYDGLYHDLHEEPEKDIVLEDMWTWLERRLPS